VAVLADEVEGAEDAKQGNDDHDDVTIRHEHLLELCHRLSRKQRGGKLRRRGSQREKIPEQSEEGNGAHFEYC